MTERPTAGTYLRLRREAKGFTLREMAFQFAIPPMLDHAAATRLLAAAESDAAPLDTTALMRLALFLPFDRAIYTNLVAGLPVPPVCRGCGCSWHDPCRGPLGPCAWADTSAICCTACVARKAA